MGAVGFDVDPLGQVCSDAPRQEITVRQRGRPREVLGVVDHPRHPSDRPLRQGTSDQRQRLTGRDLALLDHPDVPAGSPGPLHPGRQVPDTPPPRQLPARLSGLRDLNRRRADRERVTDRDRGFRLSGEREVLPERPIGERRRVEAEFSVPIGVVRRRIATDCLVRTTVVDQVGLPVARQVRPPQPQRPVHRRLERPRRPSVARGIGRDQAGTTDMQPLDGDRRRHAALDRSPCHRRSLLLASSRPRTTRCPELVVLVPSVAWARPAPDAWGPVRRCAFGPIRCAVSGPGDPFAYRTRSGQTVLAWLVFVAGSAQGVMLRPVGCRPGE